MKEKKSELQKSVGRYRALIDATSGGDRPLSCRGKEQGHRHGITARKQHEDALYKVIETLSVSEAEYRSMVEQLPGTVCVYTAALDDLATTVYIGPQIKTLGYTQDEWLRGHDLWHRSLHPEDRERVLAEFGKHRSSAGKTFHSEYRLLTRDGEVRWFRDEATVVGDNSGKPLFFHGIMQDISLQKKAEERLNFAVEEARRMNDGLHRMALEITDLEERERKKYAEMLCDGIGQNLVALRLAWEGYLEKECPEKDAKWLADISCMFDETIAKVRAMSLDLYQVPVYNMGLAAAVKWYSELFLEAAGIDVAVDMDKAVESMTDSSRVLLYRIIRECLQNILKSAGASSVEVTARGVDGGWLISVKDDGVGFSPEEIKAKPERGAGLLLMEQWARALGGSLVINSQTGKGTEVVVDIRITST